MKSLSTQLFLLGGSIELTVRLQFLIACFDQNLTPNLVFLWGQGPHVTHCVINHLHKYSTFAKWRLNLSNSLSRRHECDSHTNSRQTTLRRNV